LLASLIGQLRDFDLAEDSLQDAVEQALRHWPTRGVPDHPDAWLLTAARRRAINQLKRRASFSQKRAQLEVLAELQADTTDAMDEPITDERLRLIFTCCHPALGLPARVALTLRTVGGLSTAEIARAFMVAEPTMAQRLVRAKRKIGVAAIPYRVPPAELWAERLDAVLYVIYFIFNEGYAASGATDLVRADLSAEAIRLCRLLIELAPDEPEVAGLLALMLFHDSRGPARIDSDGALITLEDQDRGLWNRSQIAEAERLLRGALQRLPAGPYRLQAAISGVHAHAECFAETDWDEILALYRLLGAQRPSPVIELNAAVAQSFAQGVDEAIAAVERLDRDGALDSYQPFHAARADLLRRAGRADEARECYVRAIALTDNPTERQFLETRLRGLS
jgi:RNA polymerase sigma-70 factor (ECF subfamily)